MTYTTSDTQPRISGPGGMPLLNPIRVCFTARESLKPHYRAHSSTTACQLFAYSHRLRLKNPDGSFHDFSVRGGDVAASQLFLPSAGKRMTALQLWRACDRAAAAEGPTAISSIHLLAELPAAHLIVWLRMVETFACLELLPLGLASEAVIHQPSRKGKGRVAHVHFQIATRPMDDAGRLGRSHYEICYRPAWDRWQKSWNAVLGGFELLTEDPTAKT